MGKEGKGDKDTWGNRLLKLTMKKFMQIEPTRLHSLFTKWISLVKEINYIILRKKYFRNEDEERDEVEGDELHTRNR